MTSSSMVLLWLLAGGPSPAAPALTAYAPTATPFAHLTLLVDGRYNVVRVLDQSNIRVSIIPAEYQDLKITKSFAVEGTFARAYRLKRISAQVDTKYHLIPLDVLEYKEYDPSYIKFEINTAYFRNRTFDPNPGYHKIYVDFFTNDGIVTK